MTSADDLLERRRAGDPSFDTRVEVAERRGCDPRHLDPSNEADCRTLRAYLWPDQVARRRRLDGGNER